MENRVIGDLVILYGSSASGKTRILELFKTYLGVSYVVGRKYSTRERRITDSKDMRVGLHRIDKSICDISYSRYGNEYGISTNEILDCMNKKKIYGLVIQDIEAIKELKNTFQNAKIFYVYRNLSKNIFDEISESRGTNKHESDKRINMFADMFDDYIENLDIFSDVILNISDIESLKIIIKHLSSRLLVSSNAT